MMICEVNMMIEPCVQGRVKDCIKRYMRSISENHGALYSRIQRNQDLPQQVTLYFAFSDNAALQVFLKQHPQCLPSDLLQRFGNQVAANRRIFDVTEEFAA